MDAADPLLLAVVGLAGFGAGFVNVMAGGGSLLTLPALMLLGLPADLANGTNRLSIVTQSLSGIWGYHGAGKLPTRAITPVLLPTAAGSLLGALIASYAPREWLKPVLLGVMIVMAIAMAVKPKMVVAEDGTEPLSLRDRPAAWGGLFAAGVFGGFVQAGVGFVLLAVLGGMLRYDLLRANALKLTCTLVFGVVALTVFVARDQVVWLPAAVLAVTTVAGSQLGVRFTLRVDPKVLRYVLLACVLATCIAAFVRG